MDFVFFLLLLLAINQFAVAFIADIHYIKDSTGETVCMDGSNPAFYLRNGSPSNKWIVFFEGKLNVLLNSVKIFSM
jgi:hypothetical protein